MATEAQLVEAIRKADQAGDAQAVRVLGQQLLRVRSQTQGAPQQNKPNAPDFSNLTHEQAATAYSRGRERLKQLMVGKDQKVITQAIANYENNPNVMALKKRMNETSTTLGFIGGLVKPFDNMATWASNLPGVGPAVDKFGQMLGFDSTTQSVAKNDDFRARNTAKGAQLVGNAGAAGLLTYALPGGPAVQGGTSGVLLSENPTDPVALAKDFATGAAFGWAGDKTGKLVGKIIGGKPVSDNVRLLANEGVTMTPGQRGGRLANFVEDKFLGSIPLVSDVVDSARQRGMNDLRVAAANRVLAPLKTSVNKGTQINNEAIGNIQNMVATAYDDSIAPLTLQLDNVLATNLDNAVSGASREVGEEGAKQLNSYAAYLKERLANGLSGEALKREIQSLRKVASEAGRKDSLLGEKMWNLHNALDDGLTRQSGAAAPAYRNARESMALLQRFNDAASKAVNGEFSANQLLQAARRRGFGTNTGNIARGEAALYDLANAGVDVLKNKSPNSGTIPRLIATGGLLGGGYGLASGGIDPVPLTIGTAALLTPYVPGADKLLQDAALNRPEIARTIGQQTLRNAPRVLGPLGTATGVALWGQ